MLSTSILIRTAYSVSLPPLWRNAIGARCRLSRSESAGLVAQSLYPSSASQIFWRDFFGNRGHGV